MRRWRLAATFSLTHNLGATVFQTGVQTNGGSVVWRTTGTETAATAKLGEVLNCVPGSVVRAASRTRFGSVWDPTAYSAPVTCA